MGAAVALAIFLGGFGLFYASVIAGLVMTSLHIAGWIWAFSFETGATGTAEKVGEGIGLFIGGFLFIQIPLWILDIVLAVLFVGRHNRKVAEIKELATEARHQEQVAAMQKAIA